MNRQGGFVLIATLLIMVVVAILVFGTMFTTLVDRQVSANQQGATTAYYVAQSGLQQAKTRVFRGLTEHLSNEDVADCGATLAEGDQQAWLSFLNDVLPDRGTWIPFPDPAVATPIGEYQITTANPPVVNGYVVFTAVGRVGNARSTVQLIASAGAGLEGVWDNAIFAAGQPGSSAIVGNPAIYGSVQIVDEGLALDEDIFVQGTGGIYNDYRGKNAVINEANTRAVEQMARVVQGNATWQGDLPDLCTKVKIEKGHLTFQDAAARVGTSFAPIHSVYLSPDHRVRRTYGNPNSRHITNHTTANEIWVREPEDCCMELPYNFQQPLPRLHASYPNEPYTGNHLPEARNPLNLWDPDQGYISSDPTMPGPCQWLVEYSGNQPVGIKIPPADPESEWSCEANVDDPSAPISSIRWVPASAGGPRIEVNGWINIDNSQWPDPLNPMFNTTLPVEIGSLDEALEYEGMGVIRVGRCLDGDGTECTNPDSSANLRIYGELGPNGGYPTQHALGFVSSGDIHIRNGPDLVLAALVYSAGNIRITHQSMVAGAVVGTSFEFNQVPKIAYHPDIGGEGGAAEVLCMPGSTCMNDQVLGPPEGRVGPTFSEISYERR
jgi:Tfp pilus assembly protein PilX